MDNNRRIQNTVVIGNACALTVNIVKRLIGREVSSRVGGDPITEEMIVELVMNKIQANLQTYLNSRQRDYA